MEMNNELKSVVKAFLLIFIGFSFTSAGYISWIYNLVNYVSATTADFAGEVAGYLFQAIGIGLFIWYVKRKGDHIRELMYGIYAADLFCIVLCLVGSNAYGLFVIGMIMNLLHGVIAGHYLYYLGLNVDRNKTALVFGLAYGLSNIFTWLISGNLLNNISIILYVVMTVIGIVTVFYCDNYDHPKTDETDNGKFMDICLLVFMLSLVKNIGFSFSTADISDKVNIETSRIYYMAGLVIAGYINNKSRRLGSIMCLLSLIIPFISLIMINSNTGIAIIWALNYVFYGFFTVYRVIVMIDYALDKGQYHLIPVGLLAGRLGDALGTTAFIVLKNSYMYQTAISAVLYCLTVLIFFRVYNRIYTTNKTRNVNDLTKAFYKEYAISDREVEVMEMLLQNFNNKEISEKLFVSVSTVKFHIHNILKKTSCANRKQLLDLYNNYLNQ